MCDLLTEGEIEALAKRQADGTLYSTDGDEYGRLIATVRAAWAERDAIEKDLRREWWSNHGCDSAARYGDDGEMQCNANGCLTDFRRMPIDELRERVERQRLRAYAERQSAEHPIG